MKSALALIAVPAIAVAEPANSINVSPLGILTGDYSIAYERLFHGRHGVLVEGVLTRVTDDRGESLQLGGGLGYRWHWRGRQNSGFLGLAIARRTGFGEATTVVDGMRTAHEMNVRSSSVTMNLGKRWTIGRHANITFRVGAGWGRYAVRAKQDSPEAKLAEDQLAALLRFLPLAFDGELSAGVMF